MANTPNIRFKGFDDDWEEHRLETVSDVRDGTHDSPTYQSEGHPFVTSKNVKNGFVNYEDVQYISDEDFEEINKRSKVDVNDILMGMIGTIGNLALIRTEPDFAIKNVALIKDTKQVSYLYLYQYLQSKNVEKQLFWGMDGGTQKFLALKKIRELNILIPSEDEQLQIGGFLENLDDIITLYQRKFDKIKQLKKFMLQKMFPKNGELIPEIRFVGFTGVWEQRKVKDIAPLQRGFDLPTSQMEEGVYPVVMSNGIGGHHSQYKVKGPGIVTGRSGTIGRLHYIEGDYWPHNTTLWVTDFYGNNQKFIYYMYQCLDLSHFSTGSGVPTLNRNDVHDEVVCIPSVDEQKKISDYLTALDRLITLHQHKCDQLKEVKRFMLQNMFPQKG
jgi:type I restriction enzyme S subunit